MVTGVKSAFVRSVFFQAAVLGLAYWFAVALAVKLVFPVEKIALFWPPNAIAAAALILSRPRHWPLYLLAVALAYFAGRVPTGHFPLYVYFGFCAANVIEILVVAGLVRWLVGSPATNENLAGVLPATLWASILATFLSASRSPVSSSFRHSRRRPTRAR